MKILSEYKFKNDKSIRVVYRTRKECKKAKMPICDAFSLEFVVDGDMKGYGLRPDEMVIIINLLSTALFKGVKNYEIELLKGYNGFN